jgi:DNA-binding PadR family transcriptional regulator
MVVLYKHHRIAVPDIGRVLRANGCPMYETSIMRIIKDMEKRGMVQRYALGIGIRHTYNLTLMGKATVMQWERKVRDTRFMNYNDIESRRINANAYHAKKKK